MATEAAPTAVEEDEEDEYEIPSEPSVAKPTAGGSLKR